MVLTFKIKREFKGVLTDFWKELSEWQDFCVQVVAAGANPIQITRGIDKTVKALVSELKALSKEVYSNQLQLTTIILLYNA